VAAIGVAFERVSPVTADEFVGIVAQTAGSDREQAQVASRATLQTLAERIDRGQARQLAGQVPPEIAPWLATTSPAERFDVDEFLRRVASREGVEIATARRHAEAVLAALGRAVSDKEFADLTAQLPEDFVALLPRGPDIRVMSAQSFWQRVADRIDAGEADARRATDAVLETLAMRIAAGEVEDLRARLPIELHPALNSGMQLSGGKAKPMRLDAFVRRVAEREDSSIAMARAHVAAVLGTVREAIGELEFLDVTAQLPEDYKALIAR
jgi:uncharacterized protein (DUF2267 family)